MTPAKHKPDEPSYAITEDEMQRTIDAFIAALFAGNYQTLNKLYPDDCLLVRPDGAVLGKSDISDDLKEPSIVLSTLETTPISLKTKRAAGILTTEPKAHSFAPDGGKENPLTANRHLRQDWQCRHDHALSIDQYRQLMPRPSCQVSNRVI